MKKALILPVVVLFCICLVVSAALAATNEITAPIISEAEAKAAEEARLQVMPAATDGFQPVQAAGLPETVAEVYRANNGAGFVFMLSTKGYGGEMKLICGIDADGKITACRTMSHGETPGLGSKTTESAFRDQFAGQDESLSGVSAITGATISSTAYIGAIRDAFTAFQIVKEAA